MGHSAVGSILRAPYWDSSRTGIARIGECDLLSGDTLALYTDGITESFNPAGEEFGEQRLIAALRGNTNWLAGFAAPRL